MARHSASLIEHISNGYAKVIRFIYSLIPRRIFLYILRKSWESPIGFQRWNIKNSTLPLLEWKPHHVKIALPGVDANNPELLSSWIGENIRDEGLVDGWKEIDRVVLYIHGGAFFAGYPEMYLETNLMWIKMLKAKYNLKLRILSVAYTLSPEAAYPTAIMEITHAYKYLINDIGIPPSKIIVAGDSAGGFLALSFAYGIGHPSNPHNLPRELQGLPFVENLLLISPLTIIKHDTVSLYANIPTDFIHPSTQKFMVKVYVPPEINPADPRVCPLNSRPIKDWMPQKVMFTVGGKEVLKDQVMELVDVMRSEGREPEVVLEEEAHDWVLLPLVVKDMKSFERGNEAVIRFFSEAGK